jgi:hypothetical protein
MFNHNSKMSSSKDVTLFSMQKMRSISCKSGSAPYFERSARARIVPWWANYFRFLCRNSKCGPRNSNLSHETQLNHDQDHAAALYFLFLVNCEACLCILFVSIFPEVHPGFYSGVTEWNSRILHTIEKR